MPLDDLMARLQRRGADTPDTPCNPAEVSAKPAPIEACTPDTPDTPQKSKGAEKAAEQVISADDSAIDLSEPPDDPLDDRIRCTQCRNLRGRTCTVAAPGAVVSANRGYSPPRDVLQRCPGFVPTNIFQIYQPPKDDQND